MAKQEKLCVEVNRRAPSFLKSGQGTDCKFLVGAEPHQVVIGGYKLIMAMASDVFKYMFYESLAETRDHITVVDVEPEIFQIMLRYIYTGDVYISSCTEALQLCYTAQKYRLHGLMEKCSDYLLNNVNVENVCQLYEQTLFDYFLLKRKCIHVFSVNTKEVLQSSSFKDAALSTVEKIYSLDELNIDSEVDLMNAAELYARAQEQKTGEETSTAPPDKVGVEIVDNNTEDLIETQNASNGPEQATHGSPRMMNESSDTVDKQQMRSVVQHIRLLTLTPQQYIECTARSSLLTLSEDYAVLVNLVSNKPTVPMPSGLSTARLRRDKVAKARSKVRFSYTVQNFSSLEDRAVSPMFYVRNLPYRILLIPREPTSSDQKKSLGFYVQCCIEEKFFETKFCMAEVRLICHKHGAESYTRQLNHLFIPEQKDCGFIDFLPWETILDPTEGYIQDDAVTFEVQVSVRELYGTPTATSTLIFIT